MVVLIEQIDDVAVMPPVVHLSPPRNSDEFGEVLRRLISEERQTKVPLDLRNIRMVCEVVVRIIVNTVKESKRVNCRFAICEIQKLVGLAFDLFKLKDDFAIDESDDEALESMRLV